MSSSTFKPVIYGISPAIGANGPNSKVSKVAMMTRQVLPPLQVKVNEKPLLQQSFTSTTSRREMMQLTGASIGLLSLLLPAPAEARPRNATMRQKIMDKFEELRQKAGLSSKPKDESEEKKKDEGKDKVKPNVKNGSEEKKAENHSTTNEEISMPALPNILNGSKIVETILP